jgi:regulator of replication initiation timing
MSNGSERTPESWVGGVAGLRAEVARLTAENERLRAALERSVERRFELRVELNTRLDRLSRERDALQVQLDSIREVRTEAPKCDIYADDEPVSCGWKRTVQTIDAILEVKGEEA